MTLASKAAAVALTLAPLTSFAHAGVLSNVFLSGSSDIDPATGLNSGELDTPDPAAGTRVIPNGGFELGISLRVDDTARLAGAPGVPEIATGAIHDVVLILPGDSTINGVQTTGGGSVRLGGSATQTFRTCARSPARLRAASTGLPTHVLTLGINNVVTVTNTGFDLVFEGISGVQLSNTNTTVNFDVGADDTSGGLEFNAASGDITNGLLETFDAALSGLNTTIIQRGSGSGDLDSFQLEFGIVPEPASLVLVALGLSVA